MFDHIKKNKPAFILGGLSVGGSSLIFITNLVAAKTFNKESFDAFLLVIAALNTVSPIVILSINQAIITHQKNDSIALGSLSFKQFISFILYSTGAIFILLNIYFYSINHKILAYNLFTFAYLLVFACCLLVQLKGQLRHDFNSVGVYQIVPQVIRFLALLGLFISADISSYIYSLNVLSFLFLLLLMKKVLIPTFGFLKSQAAKKEQHLVRNPLLKDSSKLTLLHLTSMLFFNAPIFFLGYSGRSGDVSSLGVAMTLIGVFYIIPNVLIQKFYFSLYFSEKISFSNFESRLFVIALFSIFFSLFIYFFSDDLIKVLLGREFEGAVSVIAVICWSIPFKVFNIGYQILLAGQDGIQKRIGVEVFSLLFCLCCCFAFYQLYSVHGVAFAIVFSELAMFFAFLYKVRSLRHAE